MAQRQLRMLRGAPEAINVRLQWEPARGWAVYAICRRSGETWRDADSVAYEILSAGEAQDALEATLRLWLDGPDG